MATGGTDKVVRVWSMNHSQGTKVELVCLCMCVCMCVHVYAHTCVCVYAGHSTRMFSEQKLWS